MPSLQHRRERVTTYSILKLDPLCESLSEIRSLLRLCRQLLTKFFLELSRDRKLRAIFAATGSRVGRQAQIARFNSMRLHSKKMVKSSAVRLSASPITLGSGDLRMKSGFDSFSALVVSDAFSTYEIRQQTIRCDKIGHHASDTCADSTKRFQFKGSY